MASEQSRLDAAVDVALLEASYDPNADDNREWMRAALLAAMPVLLGEPVAYLEAEPGTTLAELHGSSDHPLAYYRSTITHIGGRQPTKRQEANAMFALYAPDLGGGK